MATKITQFRYYAEDNPNNYPDMPWSNYCTQETFKPYSPVTQLGVQTIPGTKIYLNGSFEPIIIGGSGIFELDMTNTTAVISGLRVDQKSMELIRDLPNGYFILDLVYGERGDT